MSIFENIAIAFELATDIVKDVANETIINTLDKAQDFVDLTDRRVNRKLDKILEKEDNLNALLGLENYKDASVLERINGFFTVQDKVKKTKVEYGDIIGVDRKLGPLPYQHFGIYIGNNRVIHYSDRKKDFGFDISIREDDMSRFLDGATEYFIFDCEDREKHRLKINSTAMIGSISHILSIFDCRDLLEVYSPEETVERARSKVGEKEYNLIFNNCEHFAIWCKTGIHKSTQVDDILKILVPIIMPVKILK